MKRELLVDAETLLFEAASSAECETDWGDDMWTLHSDMKVARVILEDALEEIREELGGDRMLLADSSSENFRKGILPSYKANRKKKRKPIVYQALRQWMRDNYTVIEWPGLEGDDVCGILLSEEVKKGWERVLVAIDKDMKTIPGRHINYKHAREDKAWEENMRIVSLQDANYFHMLQTLAGDSTDGYTGIPGTGMKTAEKVLGDVRDARAMWDLVVAAYRKEGLAEAAALQQAQVAFILRDGHFNIKTGKITPWQAPKRKGK